MTARGIIAPVLAFCLAVILGLTVATGASVPIMIVVAFCFAVAGTLGHPDRTIALVFLAVPLIGTKVVLAAHAFPDITAARLLIGWAIVVMAGYVRSAQPGELLYPPGAETLMDWLTMYIAIFLAITFIAGLRGPTVISGIQPWLDQYLLPFVALWLTARVAWSEKQLVLVVASAFLGACIWSGIALTEAALKRSFFTPNGVLPWGQSRMIITRSGGAFIAPFAMGTALGIVGVVAISLLLTDRLLPRWASAVTLIFAIAGVAESITRASWIGFIIGSLLTIALCQRGRIRGLAIVGGFMAVAFFVLSSAFGSSALTTRLQTQAQIYNRIVPGAAAIRLIVANPLTGLGYDGYARNRESVLRSVGGISGAYGQNVLTPHNSLLRVGVESGLFGMVGLIGIWVSLALIFHRYLRDPRRRWLATMGIPVILVYITNAMSNDMVVSRYVNVIFCVVIGVLIGAGKQAPDTLEQEAQADPRERTSMRSGVA